MPRLPGILVIAIGLSASCGKRQGDADEGGTDSCGAPSVERCLPPPADSWGDASDTESGESEGDDDGGCTQNADCDPLNTPNEEFVCHEGDGTCVFSCGSVRVDVPGAPPEVLDGCVLIIPEDARPEQEQVPFVDFEFDGVHVPGPITGPDGESSVNISEQECVDAAADGWRWVEEGGRVEFCGNACEQLTATAVVDGEYRCSPFP